MAEGLAFLLIPFKDMAALRNYVGALREDPPTQTQPFGADVNAVIYEGADAAPDPENWVILVPGYRAPEHQGALLLPPPGEEPAEKPAPRPRLRPRGEPDQLFAPHGTPGGPAPRDARNQGVSQTPPY
jgi:hypothetical protein